jgi:hypothetical protein
MLYRTLIALVKKGATEGLEEKIDIFFAAGKLTDEEYANLISALK